MGGELHLYVRDADRERLDTLPPDVSLSEIFRLGLATYERDGRPCSHPVAKCLACGELAPPADMGTTWTP